MASAQCLAPVCSFRARQRQRPKIYAANFSDQKAFEVYDVFRSSPNPRLLSVKAKAAANSPNRKPKSVICANCDGNGAVLCSQCKGSGVNSVDFFNGEFKAGDSCWLCGGKKEMLCGDCNGAGFIGGFMSTFDE